MIAVVACDIARIQEIIAMADPPSARKSTKSAKFDDIEVPVGAGGEVHQAAGGDVPVMTT